MFDIKAIIANMWYKCIFSYRIIYMYSNLFEIILSVRMFRDGRMGSRLTTLLPYLVSHTEGHNIIYAENILFV